MSISQYSKVLFRFCILCALVTCLWILSAKSQNQALLRVTLPQSLTITVEQQKDSPLTISSTKILSSGQGGYTITIDLVNKANQPIRAYAVLQRETSGSVQSIRTTLINVKSLSSAIKPGELKPQIINGNSSTTIESVVLSIDFVEFADGTTWGPDTRKSAERLAGQRAGARAEISSLKKLLQNYGIPSVLNSIKFNDMNIVTPSGHTREWNEGFRTGIDLVRERFRKAADKAGVEQIIIELEKPYDASEEKLQ